MSAPDLAVSSPAADWARVHLPRLEGQTALVTGAAGGLGMHTAWGLAALGAQVCLADRNTAGAEAVCAALRAAYPASAPEVLALDLADLGAVRRAAETYAARHPRLDLLVNNAGLLPPLSRATTADGFELKFGVNVLGHYALCSQLDPLLRAAPAPRVVWVSSLVHRHAAIDFEDLQAERDYAPQRAYNQAKLACLMLAVEGHRRSRAGFPALVSVAAHPGIARTGIGESRRGQRRVRLSDHAADVAFWIAMRLFGQSADRGARCLLQAAAGEAVSGGRFWGPRGFSEFGGDPVPVALSAPAEDAAQCDRLWAACAALTGTRWL